MKSKPKTRLCQWFPVGGHRCKKPAKIKLYWDNDYMGRICIEHLEEAKEQGFKESKNYPCRP